MHNRFGLSAFLLATLAAHAIAAPYQPPTDVPVTGIGFRGDGAGVYPNAKPPTEWDEATGRNILWKAPLPNWGYASPVQVGNRVIMTCEPGWDCIYPQLLCYDAADGTLLWRRDINPFDGFPDLKAEERQQLEQDIAWVHEGFRAAYRICAPLVGAGYVSKDDARLEPINAELARHGLHCSQYKKGYGLLRYVKYTDPSKRRDIDRRLKRCGVAAETTWQKFGASRIGTAFPTPVSDGKHLYVTTGHGTAACFDMDGRLRWSRYGYRFFGNSELMSSPRLYGDLFLAGFIGCGGKGHLIAYDKSTGRKRWEADINGRGHDEDARSRSGGSLTVMTIGDTPVVLCSTGRVVRLPDGKVFEAGINRTCGTYAVDDENDRVFGSGSHDGGSTRWGLQLVIEDGELNVSTIYSAPGAYGGVSGVYAGDTVYISKVRLSARTGWPLGFEATADEAQKAAVAKAKAEGDGRKLKWLYGQYVKRQQDAPQTRHLVLIANGHVYGLSEAKPRRGEEGLPTGVCEVYTLDGRKVATNVLNAAPHEGERKDKWLMQGFGPQFSYSCSMNISGNRIYICSKDYLYCIGEE